MNDENRNLADPNQPIEPQPAEPFYDASAPSPIPAEPTETQHPEAELQPTEAPAESTESKSSAAEPIYEPTEPEPTAPVAEPTEDHGSFHVPVVETEPVVEIPAEPEPAEPEPVEVPAEPAPEPVVEMAMPEEEIIVGAPSRPGDKPERAEVVPEPQTFTEAAPVSTPPIAGAKNKTGFRPDGVTPLDAEEKIFAGIGYISFLAFLPLVARRDSEFAQHHAWQAIVIFLAFLVLWIFGRILGIASFVAFLQIIEFIVGFVIAYKGDWFKIPGVYELSLKLKEKMPPQNPPAASNPSAN